MIDDLLYLLSEEGLAVFMLIILLIGVGYVGRWFLNTYTTRVDRKYAELLREIVEIKSDVLESNNKLYGITEQLIENQRIIGEDVNAIESSLDTLLKFINKNGIR